MKQFERNTKYPADSTTELGTKGTIEAPLYITIDEEADKGPRTHDVRFADLRLLQGCSFRDNGKQVFGIKVGTNTVVIVGENQLCKKRLASLKRVRPQTTDIWFLGLDVDALSSSTTEHYKQLAD